jgi:YVTN family beta-propeller protein
MQRITSAALIATIIACGSGKTTGGTSAQSAPASLDSNRLSTGARLDPAGRSIPVGNMPLSAVLSPDGKHLVLALSGWRQQGIDVVSRATGTLVQHVEQPGAFVGLAWSNDGRALYVSGGSADAVYQYRWSPNATKPAVLTDSFALGHGASGQPGTRYPAGVGISSDGRTLYVAENLSDSLAVLDLSTRRVVQRLGAGRFPYAVGIARDGHVYVTAWGGSTVTAFVPDGGGGRLTREGIIEVGRHPSALVLNASGTRAFVASASTDRIAVVDTRARQVTGWLLDPPPDGVKEGSTPNALALSPDGSRLYAAEADNNAVAVFDLSAKSSDVASAHGTDQLTGRVPTQWYPTAVVPSGDSLWVVNGKGRGAGPNPNGPVPSAPLARGSRGYTLGQLDGTITVLPANASGAELDALTRRVANANGWTTSTGPRAAYPPIEHVVYIIKENRTYDQVFGDLTQGDGDARLVFFPRDVSPNHHALAERFGLYDRFFVNAEVSAQGHMWSTAGYVTDYGEKTTPDAYRSKRPDREDADDVDIPAAGFLWNEAIKKNVSLRNYGERAEPVPGADSVAPRYRASDEWMRPYTSSTYPPFDMAIPDQRRADAWIAELREHERTGQMPALETLHLPSDHTAGARRGSPTPKAYMADNDLALARIVEALSRSQFWKSTAVFVLEDDAQAGPDHVDSHRSVLLVISPWAAGGVLHRFVNTTDVLATVEEILGLGRLSQFDHFGRPLREIWRSAPDVRPFEALRPTQSMTEQNLALDENARRSDRLDLAGEDRADDDEFNRILWRAVKGNDIPYPGVRRSGVLEWARAR